MSFLKIRAGTGWSTLDAGHADSATVSTTAGSATISTTAGSAAESSNAWQLNSLSGTAYATFTGNNTYTNNQAVTPVVVSLSGTAIATDAGTGNVFTITLTANATLSNPSNLKSGSTYIWIIKQGGTGSMTLAYGTYFAWSGGTAPTLTTAASAIDTITAIYNGSLLLSSIIQDIKVPA